MKISTILYGVFLLISKSFTYQFDIKSPTNKRSDDRMTDKLSLSLKP